MSDRDELSDLRHARDEYIYYRRTKETELATLRTELASQAAKIEAVRGLLQEGVDLVWSSVAHVSHGGPTKKEAEGWVNRARVMLGEPKGETL